MSDQIELIPIPFVIGVDFRSCSLSIRERLFVSDTDIPSFLNFLKMRGLNQACIVSTCDRVEILGLHYDPESVFPYIIESLANHGELGAEGFEENIYKFFNDRAIHHIFSVASSLESQIIGEPQVLGQIKASHRNARDVGMVTGSLEKLLQTAYRVAKRVRNETGIGEWSVSNVSVASHIARGLYGDLHKVSVILIGVESVGAVFAKHFKSDKIGYLAVFHPNIDRAQALAKELDCSLVNSERLLQSLIESDIVICAMGSREHILTADIVRTALIKRKNKPQFIIDLGVPGDVEPAVARLNDVFVYDAKDLESLAFEGKRNRESEATKARKIINQEVSLYFKDQTERKVSDTISALRSYFEQVRSEVLKEHSDADRATQLLINRLLDNPSRLLRQNILSNEEDLEDVEELLQILFDLKNESK